MALEILILAIAMYPLFMWVLGRITKLVAYYRARRKTTIYSQYDPPFNLAPAELGYLFEGSIGRSEIFGTLMDMQTRGLLDLSKDGRYQLHKYRKGQMIHDFEYGLIAFFEQNGSTSLKDFEKNSGYNDLATAFTADVQQSLIEANYVEKTKLVDLFWKVRGLSAIIGAPIVIFGFIYTLQLLSVAKQESGFASIDIGIVSFFIILASSFSAIGCVLYTNFLILSFHKGYGLIWASTKKVHSGWDEIMGFRLYLQVVEAPKILTKQDFLNEYASYCLALNLIPTKNFVEFTTP